MANAKRISDEQIKANEEEKKRIKENLADLVKFVGKLSTDKSKPLPIAEQIKNLKKLTDEATKSFRELQKAEETLKRWLTFGPPK